MTERLNNELSKVNLWLQANKLSLNVKALFVFFNFSREHFLQHLTIFFKSNDYF